MKYSNCMIFLMIAGLLLCIISVSSVTALEPKISKSVASLEKKISPRLLILSQKGWVPDYLTGQR